MPFAASPSHLPVAGGKNGIVIPTSFLLYLHYSYLVVSIPLKNMLVSWDDYSQYREQLKMFQSPPSR